MQERGPLGAAYALLEEWRRRLIDLTRRNRLLYFRPLRSASLRIQSPATAEVFQRLVIDESLWRFYLPEEETAEDEADITDEGEAAGLAPDAGRSAPRARKATELELATRDAKAIRRSLSNLYRRSRTDFEERGVRILFLAFGMLQWRETPQSEEIRSPLLLVPCELRRSSPRDPFELHPVDEDTVANPSLAARLHNDFHLELPQPPDTWESPDDLAEYLDSVHAVIAPRGWTVEDEVWLSLFSFHKLVVYQDLAAHAELITTHDLVAALAGAPGQEGFGAQVPDPKVLDERVKPKTSFLVLDADSSQLAAIEGAKGGGHLVVQGPPGTGKSQTITNLIAESLAAGKSVLFVSEKMAALEVVYSRLLNASLGHYCLQLHSARANKRDVVQELYRTHRTRLEPRRPMSDDDLERLEMRRSELNQYVRATHRVREPLGRSVFDALGELAAVELSPVLDLVELEVDQLTPERLRRALELSRRYALVWRVARERGDFPWYGALLDVFDPDSRGRHLAVVGRLESSVADVEASSASAASELQLDSPRIVEEARRVLTVLDVLRRSAGIEPGWLAAPGLASARASARELRSLQEQWRTNAASLGAMYAIDQLHQLSFAHVDLVVAGRECRRLIGPDVPADPAVRADALTWLNDLEPRTIVWKREGARLAEALELAAPRTIDDVERIRRVSELVIARGPRPDPAWLTAGDLAVVEAALAQLRSGVERWRTQRSALLERYDERLFEGDVQLLSDLWATRYSGWLRWFRPSFYRARRELRVIARDGRVPRLPRADMRAAAEHVRFDAELRARFPAFQASLGSWFRGLETDFDSAERAVAFARRVLELVVAPSAKLVAAASTPEPPDALAASIAALGESLDSWVPTATTHKPFQDYSRPSSGMRKSTLDEVQSWAIDARAALGRVDALVHELADAQTIREQRPLDEAIGDLHRFEALKRTEQALAQQRERFARELGSRFADLDTNIEDVSRAVDYTAELVAVLPRITDAIVRFAAAGGDAAPDPEALRTALARRDQGVESLRALFSPEALPRRAWLSELASFDESLGEIRQLRVRIDELHDWVETSDIRDGFASIGMSPLATALVDQVADGTRVLDAAKRALLARWVSNVFADEPALRRFKGENHQALIGEFRELDRRHHELGAQRVIAEIERRRPTFAYRPGGEVALLERQAALKRRHLPLRKLFSQMPGLLRALKPCLLMSPLSVSQFLDPQLNHFDVVIFDEASQIPTHDAICAIYRADQVVVCGDNKQLPPTAFFEDMAWLEEESEERGPDEFGIFESVLDECRGAGVPVHWLDWHYRSKHEALIAFSNQSFYENRLFTFPSAAEQHPRLGVELVHVPDGVYDRGGRRDNQREADVVVERVVQHFLETPERSLGVVAFSVAQQRAIEDRLELYRKGHPETDQYFDEDRLEGFFVKNLETVQGDERDVIVFSIAYGRDKNGEFKMFFGPLNFSGGERRLNVAVTRAREKVLVLSSVRAADFDLRGTTAAGVLALHRYLDYADRGLPALEASLAATAGEAQSPLEESVAGAIREMGYDVAYQVGCGKYRVDIGVIDPAEPGRFILGVECDGAMYHSAYTARDRDRIRQEVLERLGWRIHRVWSPDWTTRRDVELSRLREAIERSRATPAPLREHKRTSASPALVRTVEPPGMDSGGEPPAWAVPYEIAKLDRWQTAAAQVARVVSIEGPVHVDLVLRRVAQAMGFERTGSRVRASIMAALRQLERQKKVRAKNDFLWPIGDGFELRVRYPDGEETRRRVEHIAADELSLAMLMHVHEALSLAEEDLMVQVARLSGFERRGQIVDAMLREVLESLIAKGLLRRGAGRISLGSPAKPN